MLPEFVGHRQPPPDDAVNPVVQVRPDLHALDRRVIPIVPGTLPDSKRRSVLARRVGDQGVPSLRRDGVERVAIVSRREARATADVHRQHVPFPRRSDFDRDEHLDAFVRSFPPLPAGGQRVVVRQNQEVKTGRPRGSDDLVNARAAVAVMGVDVQDADAFPVVHLLNASPVSLNP